MWPTGVTGKCMSSRPSTASLPIQHCGTEATDVVLHAGFKTLGIISLAVRRHSRSVKGKKKISATTPQNPARKYLLIEQGENNHVFFREACAEMNFLIQKKKNPIVIRGIGILSFEISYLTERPGRYFKIGPI